MFKHQPVAPQPNSADTPPDEDIDISLPPPPSEKNIARRRESTRAVRERSPDSPPMPSSKRLKAGAGAGAALSASTSASASASSSLSNAGARSVKPPSRGGGVDSLLTSLSADAGPVKSNGGPRHVDFLTFSISQRPKPSAPTPMSPPRKPRPSRLSMGPPSEPFVRKTRKSMRGVGEDDMSGEAVVPVPEGETPMIRKNRELREAQRRSSLGMRGQRASSSLGRGEISIPHPTVETASFWKHISPTLPEPIRARHLLVYCAKRALDGSVPPATDALKGKSRDKAKGGVRTDEGDRLVKEIMEEVMANLGKGLIDTNIFSQPFHGAVKSAVPLRSHPKNALNRLVEAETEKVFKRSKEEHSQWAARVHRANQRQAEVLDHLHVKRSKNAEPVMTSAPGWMADALTVANAVIAQGEGDLSAMGEFTDVEYKVDTLHQTVHTGLQFSRQASRFLDGIFSSLTADLRNRERLGLPSSLPPADTDGLDPVALLASAKATVTTAAAPSGRAGAGAGASAGPSRPDPMAMLRALAQADAKQASEETVAAAAKVAPMPAMPSTAMTPRRVGVTPRSARTLGTGTTPRRSLHGNATTTPAHAQAE
ncbi:hypothetical protein EHS25_006010 [Saitozyma podzolica]|uniref:Uncharacterized protein n=1 Tax=Saitozyma podzolica TaxID=1890683 RepID=A0A427XTY2_9TREE|nr:hypothetical protein EHS25_006010 [Saitozyma podzolica]